MISTFKKKQQGYTLTEVILVLAVITMILTMGMRIYQSYSLDSNVLQVQQNVARIFNAMGLYYRQNCNGVETAGGGLKPGKLNPSKGYPAVYAVSLQNDLIDPGLLGQAPSEINPIVSTGNSTGLAYVTQFNSGPDTRQTRIMCTDMINGVCISTANIGTTYIWEAQVSVMLNTTSQSVAEAYLNMLGGDCLSTFDKSTGTVSPCKGNPSKPGKSASGYFVVWQRSPSIGMGEGLSSMWQVNSVTRAFNVLESTPSMSYLLGPSGNQTKYLCGG